MKTFFLDTFFMTKKYPKSLGKCNASPRSSKHQERLTNDHVGFCSLSKRLEFMPTHPRAFSEATALWILVQVECFGVGWTLMTCISLYLIICFKIDHSIGSIVN